MKNKEKLSPDDILGMADDGQVLLFDREQVLLRQIREDKQKSLVKYDRLIDKTKRDIAKAKKENPATVPKLKAELAKLKAELHEEFKNEILNSRKNKYGLFKRRNNANDRTNSTNPNEN